MLSQFDVQFHLKEILKLLSIAETRYYQILMVWGGTWQARTQLLKLCAEAKSSYYVSLGLPLSEALLDTPDERRALTVPDHFETIISASHGQGVELDRIEILFQPGLKTDPIALVKRFAAHELFLVSWPGNVNNDLFTYADRQHAEFYQKPVSDVLHYSLEVNE